jgi:hypothetical protein
MYYTELPEAKMVKNTTGGTRTKGLARKHQGGGGGGGHLRIPEDPLERVAYVSKMLGNGMCHVYINDHNEPLIAHIRKKFSGRHKRSNLIATGTGLLIGLREWENPSKNCDVINVYDHNDITNILNLPAIKTNIIAPMFNKDYGATTNIDEFVSFQEITNEMTDLENDLKKTNNKNTLLHEHEHEHELDEDIDLNDI